MGFFSKRPVYNRVPMHALHSDPRRSGNMAKPVPLAANLQDDGNDDAKNNYSFGSQEGNMLSPIGKKPGGGIHRRLINKDGASNIFLGHIDKKKLRFVSDIFTNMLEMKWRYVLLMFTGGFILSWLFFAIIYWIILKAHGDDKHVDDEDWQKCMTNVYDFTTAFLFSLETQHTIGYGFRAMEPKCPEATIMLMFQSCLGVFIQSLMTGFIFAKLSRPKKRANTIMFSKNCVICLRDGAYVLMFRVADMRKSPIVNANIRCVYVSNKITDEGEMIPLAQQPLQVEAENAVDYYLFLSMPSSVIHKIDEGSPLWQVSADELNSQHFEILVYMEGTVESSGMTVQARTSYLPSEILWGRRLRPLVTYQKEGGDYRVDSGQFHNTYLAPTMPEYSAEVHSREADEESMQQKIPTTQNSADDLTDDQHVHFSIDSMEEEVPLRRNNQPINNNLKKDKAKFHRFSLQENPHRFTVSDLPSMERPRDTADTNNNTKASTKRRLSLKFKPSKKPSDQKPSNTGIPKVDLDVRRPSYSHEAPV